GPRSQGKRGSGRVSNGYAAARDRASVPILRRHFVLPRRGDIVYVTKDQRLMARSWAELRGFGRWRARKVSVGETVSVREKGGEARVVLVHVRLVLRFWPTVAESPAEVVVTEEDLGDAVSFGSRQPSGDPGVGVRKLIGDQHRTAAH